MDSAQNPGVVFCTNPLISGYNSVTRALPGTFSLAMKAAVDHGVVW